MLQGFLLALTFTIGSCQFKSLELLSKKKMVNDLPCINNPDQLCEGCLLGKQFRKSFPQESHSRVQKPLELIHADVCGTIKPSSFGDRNYFLLFIDDFLRKTWVYFLKQKSEAFMPLRNTKQLSRKKVAMRSKP